MSYGTDGYGTGAYGDMKGQQPNDPGRPGWVRVGPGPGGRGVVTTNEWAVAYRPARAAPVEREAITAATRADGTQITHERIKPPNPNSNP